MMRILIGTAGLARPRTVNLDLADPREEVTTKDRPEIPPAAPDPPPTPTTAPAATESTQKRQTRVPRLRRSRAT